MLSTQEPGAIIALEVDRRDYSLAQLAHMIEQNDVKILSTASETPNTQDGKIKITLKLNVKDTSRIRHILEHYGYHVVASFSDDRDDDDFKDRLQEFMRYLEV
jgi:(p)ppGpp synthase/HD superfamily hydrolase